MRPLPLACAGVVPTAQAQDASPWDGEAACRRAADRRRGAVHPPTRSVLRAGIEIRLDPGWKTYWRYPGDSGVPPTLDFAGSKNVKSVTALWPAPRAVCRRRRRPLDRLSRRCRVAAADHCRTMRQNRRRCTSSSATRFAENSACRPKPSSPVAFRQGRRRRTGARRGRSARAAARCRPARPRAWRRLD